MRLYLRIRLQAARNLLFYEELPVKTVATACGFSCPAVFCRAFKARFGETPSELRASLRARRSETQRPELRRLAPVFSAWGMLASSLRHEIVRPHIGDAGALDAGRLE